MARIFWQGMFLLTLFVTSVHDVARADEGERTVRWTDAIYPFPVLAAGKASKVEDFNRLLDAPWVDEMMIYLDSAAGPERKKTQIVSCNHLLQIEHRLYDVVDPTDGPVLSGWLVGCKAMKTVARLRPSNKSFVSLDVMSMVADLGRLEIQSTRDPVKLFLSGLRQPIRERSCNKGGYACRLVTSRDIYSLSTVAAGDFDGDGVEDVIMIVTSGPVRGTATSVGTVGLVVTRTGLREPLRILEWFKNDAPGWGWQ